MSENQIESNGNQRTSAGERLSTGTLARWARMCANQSGRVMLVGALTFFALLAATVLFRGSLRDQFEIPGSDTQKAIDLIETQFASEQGGVLNLVFAAPPGEQLDTPERKAAIEDALAKLKTQEFKATEDKAGIESVGDPFADGTISDNGRIGYTEAQFDRVIYDKDRQAVVAVEDAVRDTVAPAGITAEFNGDAEFPPIQQGPQELIGILVALILLLVLFRNLVATTIPIFLAVTAVVTAFFLLFLLAGLTAINTITPLLVSMIGLGVGIDYSLFIVTRFRQFLHDGMLPQEAAAEAGASAGRAVLFAGSTVAISVTGLAFFGLDFVTKLGIGSALGVLTTVVIANTVLIAGLARLGRPRGVIRHIVLFVFTLGIYGWYWAYKLYKAEKQKTGEGPGGVLGMLLWILLLPVSAFLVPRAIRRMYERAGMDTGVSTLTGLWLFPFGLLIVPAIVWFWKVQTALNFYGEADPEAPEACLRDRPAEGAVRAAGRRFRGGPGEDAHRALGPVRDSPREDRLHRPAHCRPRARGNLGTCPSRRVGSGHTAQGADGAGGRTTFSPRASGPASTARSRSSSTSTATSRRRSGSTRASRASKVSRRWTSRSSTTRRRSRSSSSSRPRLPRTKPRTRSSIAFATTSSRRRPQVAKPWRTSPARRRRSRTSPTGSWSGCRSSCSTSSASRSSCSRWRSGRSSSR